MTVEGVVYKGSSGLYTVRTNTGQDVAAKLRGNMKKELEYSTSGSRPRRVTRARKRRLTDPISVGDSVLVDIEASLIEKVLPRRSEFARTTPGGHEQHVLVANLDRVFVTFAANNPAPDFWLLDRFLVAAEAADLTPSIIVNKIDLGESIEALEEMFSRYKAIGYDLYFVSAAKNIGISELKCALSGKISAFSGPSGVGKSSLLNTIQPGLKLKIGAVSEMFHTGRHTTTTAELIPIDNLDGAWVADTPGLRQMEFWEIDKEDIEYCFPEFDEYRGQCQFNNCSHKTEPGCLIREASNEQKIHPHRYRSYLSMI